MKCPKCQQASKVLETRQGTDFIYRRHECESCQTRFVTHETLKWVIGEKPKIETAIRKPKTKKETRREKPAIKRKRTEKAEKKLVKDDLNLFFGAPMSADNLSDFGLDAGPGWSNDDY